MTSVPTGSGSSVNDSISPLQARSTHFPAKAKRCIFIFNAGAPSQLELFDYKPVLQQYDGKACPADFMEGKRFAFLKGIPKLMGPQAGFQQYR